MEHLTIVGVVKFIFGAGMWINAAALLPQSLALFKTRNTESVSLTTFGMFLFLQVNGVFYGFLVAKDIVLTIGMLLSAIVTASIVGQIILWRSKERRDP